MAKILLLEDDCDIADGLIYSLEREGHLVVHCANCSSALQKIENKSFDLLLLDIGLPDGSGYDVFKKARLTTEVPVIFLTARDDEGNIVKGLDMGADDYITKPFRVRELLSRIASVMRRAGKNETVEINYGRLTVRPSSAQVFLSGKELSLTPMEYRLLLSLSSRPGQLFTRARLLENLWDIDESFVNDNTLSVYIKRLRDKISEASPDVEIVTVRGLGYKLEVKNA